MNERSSTNLIVQWLRIFRVNNDAFQAGEADVAAIRQLHPGLVVGDAIGLPPWLQPLAGTATGSTICLVRLTVNLVLPEAVPHESVLPVLQAHVQTTTLVKRSYPHQPLSLQFS